MVIRLRRRGAKRGIQIDFDKGTGGAVGVSEAAGTRDVLSVNRSTTRRRRQTDTGDAKIAELRSSPVSLTPLWLASCQTTRSSNA